jgi:molybdopterin-containing oxidoreductase family iron-sulfur binding subunit
MKLTRRTFLGSAAAVIGGGLVEGCKSKLPRYLVPHATPPDDVIPGLARFYRTTCRGCPAACGVTARVREGRAVKLEGNPDHPLSRGALCPVGQAGIEGLYAPGRLGTPWAGGQTMGWEAAEKALVDGLQSALDARKAVAVLTRPEPGQLGTFLGAWLGALGQPAAQLVTFDPMGRPWAREGQRRALGSDAVPVPDLAAARLIVFIGDDVVEEGSLVEAARGLADQRAAGGRSVYVGPRLSLTGASSDQWISVEPGTELTLVLGLCRQVLDLGAPAGLAPELLGSLRARLAPFDLAAVAARTRLDAARIASLARALAAAKPSLVLGPGRSVTGSDAAALAEAVLVLNGLLGNLGTTLRFLDRPAATPAWDLAELTRRAAAGEVGALVLHHADPIGYGPVFSDLGAALARIPFVVAFANELDTSARRARMVLPDHHFLESWSDVSPRPGVVGIQQPVMTPVFDTRAAADELLGAARALGKAAGLPEGTWAESVRASYDVKELEHGLKLTEPKVVTPTLASTALQAVPAATAMRGPAAGLALVVAPTLRNLDGRASRSALLQEIPDPLSGYAWTGWIELNPATAAPLGIHQGDVVALEGPGGTVELPAHVTSAVRAGLAAVPVGDATALLDGKGPIGLGVRVTARRTGVRRPSRVPDEAHSQHGRELARTVSRAEPTLPPRPPLPSMYPPFEHPEHRWGLSIDLDRCTGCGACTAACYVENNLAIVGAEDVARGRSMSWLPIHAYLDEGPAGPAASFLPVGCQHCSNAPCETVCPTFATYHTKEGLNSQIYARCIGTRYCENNCPYGVRRFNFFDWPRQGTSRLGLNPDVSVRERGVTEKCSLCVHRIAGAEETAKAEKRTLHPGEVVSACAATCPARAIVFGDLKDPGSEISRLAADGRAYRLLDELNTQPGVVYLARRRERT